MSPDIAISVKGVSKTFKIPHEKVSSIRGAFVGMFSSFHLPFVMGTCFRGKRGSEGGVSYEEFKALDDVSFEVKKGEFFGIVGLVTPQAFEGGRNGSRNEFISAFLRQAFLRILTGCISCAIFEVLKPPVLTLWAWRVLVFQK
ncbi:MAG: hypothetical protein HGB37_05135 [Candidatus Moranbacteria bacterium]|nr:hypothetical protein [Candidatus Moranbacteria bacterium]NTW90262.1 hypothetical protein [Candidatus Moranbacteria bacterium]